MEKVIGYPFVSHVDQALKPELNVETFLTEIYNGSMHTNAHDMLRHGVVKRMGYRFDFRPHLRSFLYKDNNGQWLEGYAPNKTKLRKVVYGRIIEIIERNNK